MAKIFNPLLHNCIEPKIEKILRKNQNGFWRNRSMTSQILTSCQILEGVCAKNLEATLLFFDFSRAFDARYRGKMAQILLAYCLPKETVAAIMMLYKNMKIKVCSPDGDTDYFNIVAGVLQGDTLAPYLFIICLDCMFRFNERKQFQADKGKKQKILCTNYYRCRLCQWHSASSKFSYPSGIPAT